MGIFLPWLEMVEEMTKVIREYDEKREPEEEKTQKDDGCCNKRTTNIR